MLRCGETQRSIIRKFLARYFLFKLLTVVSSSRAVRPERKAVIQGALVADRALRESDEGTLAALLCFEGLVRL